MRQIAFLTLFFLGSLNAASFSALHIDTAQSHAVVCTSELPAADCHANIPHEHDSTHAGEESLFEYIFGQSREVGLSLVIILALLCNIIAIPIALTTFWTQKLRTALPTLSTYVVTALHYSRAPPFPL